MPPTIAELIQSAVDHTSAGRTQPAIDLYNRLLTDRDAGASVLEMAVCLNNLGIIYRTSGDYEAAESLYPPPPLRFERELGPWDMLIATTYTNLGVGCRALHRFNEACDCYERAFRICRQHFPDADAMAQAATIANSLGVVLRNRGALPEAEDSYQLALQLRRQLFGNDHPSVATTLTNLATLRMVSGNTSSALQLIRQAIAIRERTQGADHPDTVAARHLLARLE